MAKKKRAKRKNGAFIVLLVLIVLCIFCVIAFFMSKKYLSTGNVDDEQLQADEFVQQSENISIDEVGSSGLEMPYTLPSGLVVDSFFQYTGINPDAHNKDAVDVASIQVINKSGKYVKEAIIKMTLDGSQIMTFIINDLPQDAVLYAFDVNNTKCLGTSVATAFEEEVNYSEEIMLDSDIFEVAHEEMSIVVSNVSEKEVKDCKLIYHDQLEEVLFGGISYQQEIETIKAGESIVIETPECYIGEPKSVGCTN